MQSAAPPPNCGAQQTLTANADAWIDQGGPQANKGTDSVLKVNSKGNSNMRALVRFLLPSLPAGCEVTSATLRLYAASAKDGRTIQALRIADAWSENAVTWATAPTTVGTAATTSSGSTSGYREWDVAAQVQAMYTSGEHNGFLIRDANENQDSEQQYNSREKSSDQPQLVLQFGPAAAPPPPGPGDTTPPDTRIEQGPSNSTTSTTRPAELRGGWRDRHDLRVPPRQRPGVCVRELHEPEDVQRPLHRLAPLRGSRGRRGRQQGSEPGALDVDGHQPAERHDAA